MSRLKRDTLTSEIKFEHNFQQRKEDFPSGRADRPSQTGTHRHNGETYLLVFLQFLSKILQQCAHAINSASTASPPELSLAGFRKQEEELM